MNRIKEFLEIRGMSQTDLAHKLGKSFNMVNPMQQTGCSHLSPFYMKLQKS